MGDNPEVDLGCVSAEEQELLRVASQSGSMAHLAERAKELGLDWPGDLSQRKILGTRRTAVKLVESHPEIDPEKSVRLNAEKIEIATAPFINELWNLWPKAQWVNANEDVQECVQAVSERRGRKDDGSR